MTTEKLNGDVSITASAFVASNVAYPDASSAIESAVAWVL
jgi:hypothetical protein